MAAIGIAMRAAAAGHVKKNRELTTTGPYGYTRNPLYLGSLIIAIGFGVASRNWWVAAVIVVLFLAIYLPVIRSEEEFLRSEFPGFDEYCAKVPRLIPRLSASDVTGKGTFSRELYLRHREYNAIIGALLMIAALAVKLIYWQ
jgi:protein-S-isoprenylcysteine O-methyltransferase Ste14